MPKESLFNMAGQKVVIFEDTGSGDRPLIGCYWNNVEWIPCAWDRTGKVKPWGKDKQTNLDIRRIIIA